MKKIFKFALLFIAACTLTTSCSEDDNSTGSRIDEQNNAIQVLTSNYLNQVVYPTYNNLATECDNLYGLISALKQKLQNGTAVSQSEIDAICNSYKKARNYWEESEAFLYGPASDFEIDPHIDTWPLDVETLAKDLAQDSKIAQLDAAESNGEARKYLTKENLGFHGLEFIFFRNGANRDVAFFNNDVTENYTYKGQEYFKGMTVTGKEEVVFAAAVACDLRDKCYQLEVAWLGNKAPQTHISRIAECAQKFDDFETTVSKNGLSYGEDMLRAATSTSTYNSWKKVVEQILVGGCSNICAEVADQKMGQAYRALSSSGKTYHEGEDGEMEEDDPDYIESPYSHNSYNDFYDNIVSIQNTLYGNIHGTSAAPASIMAYLQKYNSTMAAELLGKLNVALQSLQACKDSGQSFVENPTATCVKNAMDAISDLDDTLNEASAWILRN